MHSRPTVSSRPPRRGVYLRCGGAILIETGLTISLVLSLMIFAIQVGLVGFMQETADAASFIYAHGNTIGVNDSGGPAVVVNKIFPQIPISAASAVPSAAPTTLVAVNYLYNGSAADRLSANTNRHGGATVLIPQTYESTISKAGIANLQGLSVGVFSKTSESYLRECGQHFNLVGSTASCGSSTQPANYDIDFLTNGENTSPYFVGFNYEWHCLQSQYWVNATCSSTKNMQGMGMSAELFAHQPNVGEYQGQADGSNNLSAPGLGGTSYDANEGAFWSVACLQRNLVWIANFVQLYPTMGDLYREWYTKGPNPNRTLFQTENVTSPNHFGIYYVTAGNGLPGTGSINLVSEYQSMQAFDAGTNGAISRIYGRDHRDLTTGYSISNYPGPGQYVLSNRYMCNNNPPFGYSF